MIASHQHKFAASDVYLLHRPSRCERRVFLSEQNIAKAPRGAFDELLATLGTRHEEAHLATFDDIVDLSGGDVESRVRRTAEEVNGSRPAIYQPAFAASIDVDGVQIDVVGEPDFLIRRGDGWVIRDAKLARSSSGKPEIADQLAVYAWLLSELTGRDPAAIEILTGCNEIETLPARGRDEVEEIVRAIHLLRTASTEPQSPIGWSKCGGCAYRGHCWTRAEQSRDVALVPEVDQGLAVALRAEGVETFDQITSRFDEASLSQFTRPWGARTQRVGKKASKILSQATALSTNEEIWIARPAVPQGDHFAMFDLEGIPPQAEDTGRIYLWGMQVFGATPGPFQPAPRSPDVLSDEEVWREFLDVASQIFAEFGDLPFVHWANYERTQLREYVRRYGDPDGVAARVEANLLDLLPITRDSVALPLPSYSLKVVEEHVGFERTQDEFGGDWSIAKFIEATETEDIVARTDLLGEVWKYNEEDLAATWAVFQWLRQAANLE